MLPQRVQIPVLKQGTVKTARWSTRILTIDVGTATVIISRHNHPNNILYHALRVEYVQMWPRFAQSLINDDFGLMEAKLTLRIVGENVAVPAFSADAAGTLTDANCDADCSAAPPLPVSPSTASSPSHSFTTTPNVSAHSSSFSVTSSDAAKQSRPLASSMNWLTDAWLIRFTTFESYELAVRLLLRMRTTEHLDLRGLCPYVEEDLRKIKAAWLQQRSIVVTSAMDAVA